VLGLLLLAIRAPAEAPQTAGSQADAARGPGAANRSDLGVRKPAWKWTVEERLARRFDPQAIAARAREQAAEREAYYARHPELSEDPLFKVDDQGGPPTETIEGTKTPELFLTWELFLDLLNRSLLADGLSERGYRERIEERAAALGFGKDLWPRLEEAAAPFIELRRKAEPLRLIQSGETTDGFKMDAEGLLWCRTRAQAITAAKAEFGEEAFLRLLYEAVAPNLNEAWIVVPGLAEHLRFLEGGCQ